MDKKVFAYAVNSRVVWLSDRVYHVPVLDDFYRVYLIKDTSNIDFNQCTNYTVLNFHRFAQERLIYTPLEESEKNRIMLINQKMKYYERLCDLINYSYAAALPPVFIGEKQKINCLSDTIINKRKATPEVSRKNRAFVASLIADKRLELVRRYKHLTQDLKEATTLEQMQNFEFSIVYEAIGVV